MDGSLTPIVADNVSYVTDVSDGPTERIRTSVLTILEAFPEDAGTYQCLADNVAGSVDASAELTVHGMSCLFCSIY